MMGQGSVLEGTDNGFEARLGCRCWPVLAAVAATLTLNRGGSKRHVMEAEKLRDEYSPSQTLFFLVSLSLVGCRVMMTLRQALIVLVD